MTLPKYWICLPADEGVSVRLTEIRHEDVGVSPSGDNLAERLVRLESPDSFLVTRVGGDTPLLAQRPEFDGPIAGS